MNDVLHRIREVWGGEDDFREGGFEYVAFVISQDLEEMAQEDWETGECTEEMADVAINALRALDELSDEEPADAILQRLDSRMEGEVATIIDKYQTLYERHG